MVGEREQGTLEPVLITPISREEFLVGKALAAPPTLMISYAIFGSSSRPRRCSPSRSSPRRSSRLTRPRPAAVHAVARRLVDLGRDRDLRPLCDIRVAQQLSVLASLPPLAIVALMQFKVIPSTGLALALAAALLIVDGLGWRAVAAIFDRERLITGARS